MFEQNDKTLFTAQSIIKIFCIIGAILCFIGGIILCVTSSQEVTGNLGEIKTITNYTQIIGGVALIDNSDIFFKSFLKNFLSIKSALPAIGLTCFAGRRAEK